MHAHFSRFIRPGAKILESAAEGALVAQVPETGNLVVVLLNSGTTGKSYSIDVSKFPQVAATASVYTTNATDNLKKLADVPVQAGKLAASVPAKSLVTLVIPVGKSTSLRSLLARGQGLDQGQGGRRGKSFSGAGLYIYPAHASVLDAARLHNAAGRALRLVPKGGTR